MVRLELARAQMQLAEVLNGQGRMLREPEWLQRDSEFLPPAEIERRRVAAVAINADLEQLRVELEQKIARLERRIVELGGYPP